MTSRRSRRPRARATARAPATKEPSATVGAGMNTRPARRPGPRLFERGGEAEQLPLLAEGGDKLHADGEASAAGTEWQRQCRMAGAVEQGGKSLDWSEVVEQVLHGGTAGVEL